EVSVMSRLSAMDAKVEQPNTVGNLTKQLNFYVLVKRILEYYESEAVAAAIEFILKLLFGINYSIAECTNFFQSNDDIVFDTKNGLRLNSCQILVEFQQFFIGQTPEFCEQWINTWDPLLQNLGNASQLKDALQQKIITMALLTQKAVQAEKAAAKGVNADDDDADDEHSDDEHSDDEDHKHTV